MTFYFNKVQLAGQIMADFLVPLVIWSMLLSSFAVIVLLLGSEPA